MNKYQIEQILRTKVERIAPYRTHWVVQTADQKRWMAKKVNIPVHLKWWHAVDGELRSRGFHSMPELYTDGVSYVLTPWIQGKNSSYQDLKQAVRLMRRLALFHQAGMELQTPPKRQAVFPFYHRLYTRLKRFYRLMCQVDQISGEVGKLLAHVGPAFYRDGYRAWQKIAQLPIQAHTEWNRKHHCLAHRDLASHNWLIDRKRQIWLIDFDTADYDSQLGDVWQMLTRIMAEHNWDEQAFTRLLASYEAIRPLDMVEKRLLFTLLCFPNEFFREAIGLCTRKAGYVHRSTFPYLQRLAKNRQHWRKQTTRFSSW